METFSASLALSAGNSPVTNELPTQRPVTRSFDVFFELRLNKRLSKQSWGWWFETPLRSLWRHCNTISVKYSGRYGRNKHPLVRADKLYKHMSFAGFCYVVVRFKLILPPPGGSWVKYRNPKRRKKYNLGTATIKWCRPISIAFPTVEIRRS